MFFLGTHEPSWLRRAGFPLFVSHRRLARLRRLPRAIAPWALDSGGFTELNLYGEWRTTPGDYVRAVRRYRDEVGSLVWAAPQDWMCEPAVLARTGMTVAEHQRRTVENFIALRTFAPDLPFIPVVQGWKVEDYVRCADLYGQLGVDLAAELAVGVGTVCRRQDTATAAVIFAELAAGGLRLHGFGVKLAGLAAYSEYLTSADSMAWSFRARRAGSQPECGHSTCSSCLRFATRWRESALAAISAPEQLAFAVSGPGSTYGPQRNGE